jgi:hypothetical protein
MGNANIFRESGPEKSKRILCDSTWTSSSKKEYASRCHMPPTSTAACPPSGSRVGSAPGQADAFQPGRGW